RESDHRIAPGELERNDLQRWLILVGANVHDCAIEIRLACVGRVRIVHAARLSQNIRGVRPEYTAARIDAGRTALKKSILIQPWLEGDATRRRRYVDIIGTVVSEHIAIIEIDSIPRRVASDAQSIAGDDGVEDFQKIGTDQRASHADSRP